ncbi:MAG: LPP20 family lipoprotein [Deltaproteobacteria bacterium]|nr:MAG: LPP20 family lipoprotein [Deltaproteobacteria bacterium]
MKAGQYFWLRLVLLLFTLINIGCATGPKSKSDNVPEWLQQMPKDDKYFYAIGISGQTRRAKNAWDQAILRARAELGKTIITHVTSQDLIISTTRGEYTRQVIEALSDAELNFTEVTERWWDRRGDYGPANHYYVLVRLEKKRAEMILKDLK